MQAIHDLIARAQELQSDTDRLMALHAPDTVIVNIAGRRVMGRDAFASAMTQALASPLASVRTTVEVLDIRFATADVAIVSCVKTVHDERDPDEGAEPLPSTGALTYVVAREDDGWRIALAQTTPVL